jgi:hypothetical protein
MAFTTNTAALISSGFADGAPALLSFKSTTDDLATIKASAYFNEWIELLTVDFLFYIIGTDGADLVKVTSVTTNVTVSSILGALPPGSVELADLAAGIKPSNIIKFDGKESNGGGSATIAIMVAGTLATDLVYAQVEASTNAVEVQKVTPTTDTVTVLLSGDPGASTIITWEVHRAAV